MSTRFDVGDYVRWPIGVKVFSASSDGEVIPVEVNYAYGIIVDVARGNCEFSDVVIIYSSPYRLESWVVCHVDDEEYQLELISEGDSSDVL